MRAADRLARAQFGKHGPHVRDRAAHPLQLGVRVALSDERRAHLVVGDDRAVVALDGFVKFDPVVADGGRFELLGDATFHVARRLAHLEQARVRVVVDGVGVDAKTHVRLLDEYLFGSGLAHSLRLHRGLRAHRSGTI